MLILFGAFLALFPQIFAEDITISCHIRDDANRTHPNLGISHGMQGYLIECSNYLRRCHVNNSNLKKSHSQIECVTNVGINVNCTYTDFWLRDTHCGPEFNDSSCEMMTISCPKEELVMTTAKGEDLILLLSIQGAIFQYDLSANRKLELIGWRFTGAMDYWLKGSTIFWLERNSGKIYMCNLTKNLQFPKMIACDDNGNRAVLVEHNIRNPNDLAVDWIHGLLFWTDYYSNKINVMDLNTKQRKVLFKDLDNHLPIIEYKRIEYQIAVDPSKGLIFWTEWRWADQRGTIERASMDGNDRMTIAKCENRTWIIDIALDIFNERVYYTIGSLLFEDYRFNNSKTIVSIDYNGNDLRTISLSDTYSDTHITIPSSLAIFEDKLFCNSNQDLFVMNKFNGTEVRKLISVYDSRTVRVYHNAAQPELPNKCDQHSCGDGAICLPKGNSFDNEGKPQPLIGLPYTCVCADGYKTGEEPNTCVLREDQILLLSSRNAIYQYDLSIGRKLKIIDNPKDIYTMDYWLKGSTIIWATYNLPNDPGKIYMCNLTKNLQFPKMIACDDNHTVLVEHNILYPVDLAVDWTHGLLFWTDRNTINVMDLSTKQRKVLFNEGVDAQRIAVDPSKGLIFWIHLKIHIPYEYTIKRASMDGNDRMLISGVNFLDTVRVYHNAAQPELPNKCDQHSCGDGAICLPKGNSSMGLPYSCVCADGYTTGEEPNTCVLRI